jgi:hypothetical protein
VERSDGNEQPASDSMTQVFAGEFLLVDGDIHET